MLGNKSEDSMIEHRTEAINSRVYQPGFSIILIIQLGIPSVISVSAR